MPPRCPHVACALVAVACAAAIPGCGYLLRSPGRPTPAIHYRAHAERRADCLLVLIPGFLDAPDEFARRGVVEDLHRVAPGCDLVAIETHLYDYRDESIVPRVHEDIVLEARDRGYRSIWLVGVSMGAIGAILTAREHPSDVDGLVLISPFLGTAGFAARLEREVADAGGISAWARTPAGPRERISRVLHDPRPVWRWLAGYRTGEARPPLWVGYGRDDRFAPAQALLTDVIAPEHGFVIDGRHDWATWRRLCQDVFADLPVDDGGGPAEPASHPRRALAWRAHDDAW